MSDEWLNFQALRLTAGDLIGRIENVDARQMVHAPEGLENRETSVSVLPLGDLEALIRFAPSGKIADRGAKHPARPLAAYLVGRSGLVAIRAHYSHAGQARRGLRGLVESAAQNKALALYLVGINLDIFEKLKARAIQYSPVATGPEATVVELDRLMSTGVEVPQAVFEAYVGISPLVDLVRRRIMLAARVDHPVLIQGETGTGKEVVAWQIHNQSKRKAQCFTHVNCGGIPGQLFESELFGHTRGAFTGATHEKRGFWTLADKGTLFLDEVGDLPLVQQVKVLRALEAGRFFPVGAESEKESGARVIAATNRDLARMVADGQFREDLYYRLFTFRIRTPALREHLSDIPSLARYFWKKLCDSERQPLPRAVVEELMHYWWPGNARELRAVLFNLHLISNGRTPDAALIRAVLRERRGPAA